jgi:flagellar FliJ protein
MSTFRFRLATLLRLREAVRDEKRAQLADAYRALEILAGRLREVDAELAAERRAAQKVAHASAVDLDYLTNAHRYEILLRAQRGEIVQQQTQIAQEVERRRLALVEADRQVRVLEKLRDKQAHEFALVEERREMKRLDELAGRARSNLGEVLP